MEDIDTKSMQFSHWCITLNNPTDNDDWETAANTAHQAALDGGRKLGLRYLVWQLEKGEAGTIHLQGYAEFYKTTRMAALKKLFGQRGHYEQRKGTRDEARDYCMKEDSREDGPWEIGVWLPEKGKKTRSDLLRVKKMIEDGSTELDIADKEFCCWAKNIKAIERYKRMRTGQRNWKTKVIVMIGEPGTGKSSAALAIDPDAYWKQKSNWWDGYDGHDTVVVDEYYGWLAYDTLNRLCDRYPMLVETKGGQVNFVPKLLIFTSNLEVENWYKRVPSWESFLRRIDEVWRFEELGKEPEKFNGYKAYRSKYPSFINSIHTDTGEEKKQLYDGTNW